MPNDYDRFIALPPLAFRIGVTGASRLDEAAKDRLRTQVATVLDCVKAELDALAGDVRVAGVYRLEEDGRPFPRLRIVSPLGAGADRLVAEEALRLGYTLETPLPFAQPVYEGTFPDSMAEFQALLAAAGPRTRNLSPAQAEALDALLTSKEGTPLSVLGWARQPPGAPGHKALARIVEQLTRLRTVGLDPACAEGVHPERLRKLAREGGRYTAQHLRALSLRQARPKGRFRGSDYRGVGRRPPLTLQDKSKWPFYTASRSLGQDSKPRIHPNCPWFALATGRLS